MIDVVVGDTEMDEIYMAMEYVEQVGDPVARAAARELSEKGTLGAIGWLIGPLPRGGGCAGCVEVRIWRICLMRLRLGLV